MPVSTASARHVQSGIAPNALSVLNSVFGLPAFRGAQEEIVGHVVNGGNCLVLMPTGGGKSLCYQLPSLLREGCGIVVSPLIALMRDQVAGLLEAGVRAAVLNSTLSWDEASAATRDDHRQAQRSGIDEARTDSSSECGRSQDDPAPCTMQERGWQHDVHDRRSAFASIAASGTRHRKGSRPTDLDKQRRDRCRRDPQG